MSEEVQQKVKAVSLCSQIHSPYCLILQPNLPQCLSCCLGGASPPGAWVWFLKIVFSASHCAHQLGGWAGKQSGQYVNEVWERREIVMCIAIPDTCILAKSNQLIKYSSLVTHRLRP